ncbi:MAG TPA: S8 family serine peptidase [Streptosporangiaceae bacterium]
MRRAIIATAAVIALAVPALPAQAGPVAHPQQGGTTTEYVVLYTSAAQASAARAAVTAAGGTIVRENRDIGLATVRTTNTAFIADARRSPAVQGVAHNRAIGQAPKEHRAAPKSSAVEKDVGHGGKRTAAAARHGGKAEPLAGRQWDLRQMGVLNKDGSYQVGSDGRGVRVGVIDTGVDGDHPDIKANFDRRDSRNFTTDIPADADGNAVDGPCEHPSCVDPADEDDNEHGTHVASEIASPRNGLGMAGIAPRAEIVNVRAGQDSGFFFLQPTVDALTYSGRIGLNVVNMSFYVDPWQWNCASNPKDSAEARQEQVTVIAAVQRALRFAHDRGVTLVSAAGNFASDYTKPILDNTSPDYVDVPGKAPYDRTITPGQCLSMPSQGTDVLAISATGPSERKSYFSDYGKGYVAVAAPGGDAYDTADGKADPTSSILAAYPAALAKAAGVLNPDGSPNTPSVVRDCKGTTCAYYQYLQGTSMASPHAVGLAALIIGRYGHRTRNGVALNPDTVKRIMLGTARAKPCPPGGTQTYTRYVLQADGSYLKTVTTAACEGGTSYNGFYGNGIIDARRAVGR